MEAVRKIVEVKNNAIMVKDLAFFNNKRVEVIVLPLLEEERAPEGTGNLHKFAGTIKKFGDGIKYQKKIRSEWEDE
ncbi:MAG: hypothetical protein ACM3SY_10820 [Candidatus Omnitrophota bacterium]